MAGRWFSRVVATLFVATAVNAIPSSVQESTIPTSVPNGCITTTPTSDPLTYQFTLHRSSCNNSSSVPSDGLYAWRFTTAGLLFDKWVRTSATSVSFTFPSGGTYALTVWANPGAGTASGKYYGAVAPIVLDRCQAKPASIPSTLTGAGWRASFALGTNGVTASNVMLGSRLMARSIGVGRFRVETSKSAPQVVTLGQDRILRVSKVVTAQDLKLEVTFTLPIGTAGSCLTIVQLYHLQSARQQNCEPTGTVKCARFWPTVAYRFDGADGESIKNFTAEYRLDLRPSGGTQETIGVFRDCDLPGLCVFARKQVPVSSLALTPIIRQGMDAGNWDNLHETSKPVLLEPAPGLPPRPGCPECVHIHWRWGTSTFWVKPGFSNGAPLVPTGSRQSVGIAVTGAAGSRSILYSASATSSQDTFFSHGGFFVPAEALVAGRVTQEAPVAPTFCDLTPLTTTA